MGENYSIMKGHLQYEEDEEDDVLSKEDDVLSKESDALSKENDAWSKEGDALSKEHYDPDPEAGDVEDVKVNIPSPSLATGGSRHTNKKSCCSLALDIVAVVFLFIMTIFFLAGSLLAHPRTYEDRVDEPYVFFFLGVLCYLTTAIIDLVKRTSKCALEISMASIAVGGGFFWFLGSIFLFSRVDKMRVWASLWIFGCLLNLTTITHDLVMVFLKHTNKPLFRAISLKLSWMANLLFIVACIQILKEFGTLTYCEMGTVSDMLTFGATIYFIHAIFHTLSLFLGGITFTVNRRG